MITVGRDLKVVDSKEGEKLFSKIHGSVNRRELRGIMFKAEHLGKLPDREMF